MATPVLLLRAPASPPETDRYETALRSAGFHPVSVPVLETALVNIHDLSELLTTGPQEVGLRGVIVTSARAAEAWANAVERVAHLENGDEGIIPLLSCHSPRNSSDPFSVTANWTAIPFYAVGTATADSLSSISSSSHRICLTLPIISSAPPPTAWCAMPSARC